MKKNENFDKSIIENEMILLKYQSLTEDSIFLKEEGPTGYIQFHFVNDGISKFSFNKNSYQLEIKKGNYLTLYNPERELPIDIEIINKGSVISIVISISRFHNLLSSESSNIKFLDNENINKKHYKEDKMTIGMQTVLNQIFNYNKKSTTKKLFLKSKLYELISQIFDSNNEVSIEQCPVFINSEYFKKIRLAKEILISNFSSPPTLEKLSDEVGLSLKKLKIGFKEVYGKPAYQYLIDHKMEIAKNMITNGKLNINEISDELGYNNASHFISSFKKKFGITPKSFLNS